jgi:predicted metalloprotease with PDZ domain
LAVLIALLLPAAAIPAVAQSSVDYLIRVEDPGTQLFHVEAVLPANGAATLVSLPSWTPGYYETNNYARYVRNFTAHADDGSSLRWERADKDTWRILTRGASRVRVSFDFLANNVSLDGSVLRPDFGFFNGTNLFVFPETGYDFPARVRFELPAGWQVATELAETGEPGVYSAADFHELVDNPTFVGHFAIDSAQADGRWIRLAVYPADVMSDPAFEETLDALQRIADYSHDLFGAPPYERYTTFVYAYTGQANSGGGLEHANSHLDIVNAAGFQNAERGLGVSFGLLSHEYYHAWNVKRIRPAEMWPYDYENEQYTPLLWVSEGFTSYYGPLILTRTGLRDEEGFWTSMQGNIGGVESEPYQASVEDISLATWINPIPISGGYYYSKGALIGLLLDIKIRSATDNRHSLDDVMYQLYHEHYERNRGFTTEDFLRYVAEHIGEEEMQLFYRAHIDGREPLPYGEVLELAGMSFRVDTIVEPLLGIYPDYSQEGRVLIDDMPVTVGPTCTGPLTPTRSAYRSKSRSSATESELRDGRESVLGRDSSIKWSPTPTPARGSWRSGAASSMGRLDSGAENTPANIVRAARGVQREFTDSACPRGRSSRRALA